MQIFGETAPELAAMRQRISDANDALRPLAAKAHIEPVCWIDGSDQGIDWCPSCGEKEVARLKAADLKGEYFLDGGYDLYHENDGTAACNCCGQPLGYSLTRYGVEEEIGNFLENGVLSYGRLLPMVAFEVSAILDQAPYINDAELVADALRIGETAASLIDYDEELARFADDGGIA